MCLQMRNPARPDSKIFCGVALDHGLDGVERDAVGCPLAKLPGRQPALPDVAIDRVAAAAEHAGGDVDGYKLLLSQSVGPSAHLILV